VLATPLSGVISFIPAAADESAAVVHDPWRALEGTSFA
jgi:hypothetical protein